MEMANSNATYFNRATNINDSLSAVSSDLCYSLQEWIPMERKSPLSSVVLSVTVNFAFALFTSLINIIAIIALTRNEQLRTAGNLILTSMAVSDFLVGFIVQPLKSIHALFKEFYSMSCLLQRISYFAGMLGIYASLFNICLFALDRTFATCLPYRYLEDVIYNKYLGIIVCGWLVLTLAVILAYASILERSMMLSATRFLYFFCLAVILLSYTIVYRAAQLQRRRIKCLQANFEVREKEESKEPKPLRQIVACKSIQKIDEATSAGSDVQIEPLSSCIKGTGSKDNTCYYKDTLHSLIVACKSMQKIDEATSAGSDAQTEPLSSCIEGTGSKDNTCYYRDKGCKTVSNHLSLESKFGVVDNVLEMKRISVPSHCKDASDLTTEIGATFEGRNQRVGIERIESAPGQSSIAASKTAINSSKKKHFVTNFTVVLIIGAFILCYMPSFILTAIARAQDIPDSALVIVNDWTNTLVLLNSAINPILYCVRVAVIRREMKRVWKKLLCCRSNC